MTKRLRTASENLPVIESLEGLRSDDVRWHHEICGEEKKYSGEIPGRTPSPFRKLGSAF